MVTFTTPALILILIVAFIIGAIIPVAAIYFKE